MNTVYIIFAKNQTSVKIGRSNNEIRRFKELKTSFMDDADFCLLIRTDKAKEVEYYLHQKFLKERQENLHGKEWFILSSRLQRYLLCEIRHDPFLRKQKVRFIEETEWEDMSLAFTYEGIEARNFIKELNQLKRIVGNIILYAGIWYIIYDAHNLLFESTKHNSLNWNEKSFIILKQYGTPTIALLIGLFCLHYGSKKDLIQFYSWLIIVFILYLILRFCI